MANDPDLLALVDTLRRCRRDTPELKAADVLQRLVVADYFDERAGDPARSEFIRLSVRFHDDDLGKLPARERRQLLWKQNRERWTLGLGIAAAGTWCDDQLGFVGSVYCSADEWRLVGPRLVPENPVQAVRCSGLYETVPPCRLTDRCPATWAAWAHARAGGRSVRWADVYSGHFLAPDTALPGTRGRVPARRLVERTLSKCAISWALWEAHGRPSEGEFA